MRRRILDETRQDPVDAVEAGGSGVGRQDEDVDAVDDDDNVDDDGEDTETAVEEVAKKKREEAAKKKEAAAKKKAVEKKAEDAKKAKKAAEVAKEKADREKRVRDRERERRKEREDREREARTRRSRTRSRSRSRSRGRSRSRRGHRSRESRRSRSRRSRSRRSKSGSLDNAALKTQVERLTEKVKYMESKKRWNSLSNEKQYLHEVRVRQLAIEDVRKQLEDHFGSKRDVPEKIEGAIRLGEKEIDNRIKLLKMADKASWSAVEKYAADPLCDDDEDDKKWKAAVKEAKEEQAKRKGSGYGYGNRNRGRDGYRSGGRSYRRDSRDRRTDRYVKVAGLDMEENCAGKRLEPATPAGNRATSGRIVGRQRETGNLEGETVVPSKDDFIFSPGRSNKHLEDKVVFDQSEERLDKLEGKLIENEDEICLMFEEDDKVEDKVHDTLRKHIDFWRESGASDFAVSVILNGYVPQMQRRPERYMEENNKSYRDEMAWANEAVYKLQRAKIVVETRMEELWCINPLTVAKNAKGKRRLCIDLSRCVNKVIKAPKFKIQSTMAALQIVEKGDWLFSFDLKSAYLQVPINENFVNWFGFSIEEDDGLRRYFFYKQMPFGLNDACRVLTKLLRSPLERWRRQGINVYLHVDDGLGIVQGREAAVRASECVRKDLKEYGLLMSEDKSEWGARREIVWTGFVWDTVRFKLYVPEDKLQRAELLIKELLKESSESVKVRKIAKIAGLIGSFTLAMGSVARFYSRGMLSQVAKMVNREGWESAGVLEERVIGELKFWQDNLRKLNGWTMRVLEDVTYCKENCINMFSDASEFQLAGAQIEDGEVSWDTRFKVALTEEERNASSTYRELRGIEEGLKSQGERLRGMTVRWGCDNWAAGKICKWGSMKPDCHGVAVKIEEICRKYQIRLETFWLSRDSKEIEFCDQWSKEVDTADYWIEMKDFRRIEERYGPFSADYFASDRSWRKKPFFAKFGVGESSGLDAFSVGWKYGTGYFHPPVGLVWKVVRKAERERADGILIAPDWPGSVLLAVLESRVKEGKIVLMEKWTPFLICPREIGSDTFRGKTKFKLCVYRFTF